MFITTKIAWDMNTGEVLEHEGYEYSGPVAECKKGRKEATGAANVGLNTAARAGNIAAENRGIQRGYRQQGDVAATDLLGTTLKGQLSPGVARQLEQEKRGIGKAYGDVAQVGLRGLAARGMGGAPTGYQASLINTAGRGAGEAETSAIDEAYKNQLGLGLEGLKYVTGQQEQYDPLRALQVRTGAAGQAAQAAGIRSQMGSKLGDIGKGLTTLGSVFKPAPA